MRLAPYQLTLALALLASRSGIAADKNGVSPQAISLPTGPGSIQGLGESFQPQLNTGGATYAIPLALPGGTGGHTPTLQLSYDSGAANGPFGLGWMLNGVVSVTRNTDAGVPRYVDGPNNADDDGDGVIDNPQEIDIYSGMDREELVPLADGSYRAESESAFTRYERSGPGWIAHRRNGTRFELGMTPLSRVEDSGRVFAWLIDQVTDTDGNVMTFDYFADAGSPGQKYLRSIRWGQPTAFFTAVFTYTGGRPDVQSDFRSGFEVRTALRVARIDVVSQGIPARPDALTGDIDGNGVTDSLIRRWKLEYHPDAPVSLLASVTQLGVDGVTALPPVTLEYTRWTPPTSVAALVIQSKGEPAETLSSSSVELCDMNGDGLPDLLSTSANQHRVAVNLGMTPDGRLEWAPAIPVGNAPTIDIGSSTAHLADATADGLSDLVVKVSNTRFLCFDNTSQNSWTAAAAPLRNTDTWPIWPFDGANGAASRSMDTDHNRRNDILFTSNNGYELWLLLPQGQYARETRIPPLLCEGQTFRFDLPGTHIADMNGDRLQDLVWVQASRVVWFPNQGRDRFGPCQILPLGLTLSAADIEKTGFSDIDGDGLEDLTVVRPSTATGSVLYWLNRFQNGLDGPRRLDGLPAALAGDALRWADLNGNGSADIVISNSARTAGSRLLVVDLLPDGKPYLLSSASNGLGLVTRLEHETSVDQMVRARQNGTPWSSVMQISVPVVRSLTEDDGRGNLNVREITYRDPYWNATKQEFRGFRDVQLREVGDGSASDKVTRHRFDAGLEADCMKGKELLDETLDETGKVSRRDENTWTRRVLAVGNDAREVCFAFPGRTDTTVIEGIEAAIGTRVEKDYDAFGNVTVDRNLGIADSPGDEVVVMSEYETRTDTWLIDLLSRRTTLDGNGKKMAEERFFYDARGHQVRQELWLDAGDRFIVKRSSSYDAFGNLIEQIDANGHRRTIEYDSLIHAYAVAERVHLESGILEMQAAYDLGLGILVSATDFTGAQHQAQYDALGRITSLALPGGALRTFSYHLGNPVSFIQESHLVAAGGDTQDSFTFSDGYGRKLGKKVEAEGGKWRYLEAVRYNSRKLVSKSWLPLETAGPAYEEPLDAERHESFRFDAMGRNLETVHPDGSATRNEYDPLLVREFDENDTAGRLTPLTIRRDGLDRIVEVVERNGAEAYTTTYRWSTLGTLLEIHDAQSNVKRLEYDSLRRLTKMSDPDRGTKTYFYDDSDNLTRTLDAKGQQIEYEYDFADRLKHESRHGGEPGTDSEVDYNYDSPSANLDLGNGDHATATFTAGRLASAIDPSGETHFSYDARGNKTLIVNRIKEPHSGLLVSYATRFSYDLLDRLVELVYPDEDRVHYTYNAGDFPERIDGGAQGLVLVGNFDHHPSGQLSRIEHGNGVVTSFSYDARDRLSALVTEGQGAVRLIDNEYRYDPASNLTHIIDRRPFAAVDRGSPRRNTQVLTYDDLDRLTRARYAQPDDLNANLGQIDFGYDAIGNVVLKSTPGVGQPGHLDSPSLSLGAMTYGGGQASGRSGRVGGDPPGPHALTRTASGKVYEYDATGNMTRREGAQLKWDPKDQLVSYQKGGTRAAYLYDYSDRRVAKTVTIDSRRTDETIYVNQYYEERPGRTPIKFVFSDARRIARVEGAIDPTRDRIQRVRLASGWNAVTAAVATGKTLAQLFGADATFYTWSAGNYQVLAGSHPAQPGEPLWVHAPTARLAVLKGTYDPPAAPVAIPAGGALVAWPRLEAFVPSKHLSAAARVFIHDASSTRWLLGDPSLPAFLQDLTATLPSAGALWIDAPPGTLLQGEAQESLEVQFYHLDHLGSSSVTTDLQGALVEEIAYFPYGEVRNRHSASSSASTEYDFTGKETDDESGLIYLGARFYDPIPGRFISVDPMLSNPASLDAGKLEAALSNPQKHGIYTYVLDSPLRYLDPNGLDARGSGPTVTRTAAEAQAYSDSTVKLVSASVFSKPVPRQSTYVKTAKGDYVQVPPGRSVEDPRVGWKNVTIKFTVTGPDGKPVKNHFFQATIEGKNGESASNFTTNKDGVVVFSAAVPPRGGTIGVTGTFDEGEKVKFANTMGIITFQRQSGQDQLNFNLKLENITVPLDSKTSFDMTKIELKQK